jgi:hypothetical protein
VKSEATPRQPIERRASAPVERKEAAGFARCSSGALARLDDKDLDPSAAEEVGGAGADHTAAADHNPHYFSLQETIGASFRASFGNRLGQT